MLSSWWEAAKRPCVPAQWDPERSPKSATSQLDTIETLGAIHKRRPQSEFFVHCGQGGFFRCGYTHFLEQKLQNLWFVRTVKGGREGWASADIFRTRGEGASVFRDFVRTAFMDGSLHKIIFHNNTWKKKKKIKSTRENKEASSEVYYLTYRVCRKIIIDFDISRIIFLLAVQKCYNSDEYF